MPRYVNALVPSWQKFRNVVPVEVSLLHLQPSTKYHFHFLIIMDLAVSSSSAALSHTNRCKGKAVPLQALEWPRGFQEVKVPIFHDGTGR